MRMSSKGRLAVQALIDLALHERTGPVALLTVSRRLQVSLSYLEQLFADLRRQGIVASTRGPGGGYTLARDSAQVTVADIVSAVDGAAPAPEGDELAVGISRRLWQHLDEVMLQHMAGISLQTLLGEHPAAAAAQAPQRPVRRAAPAPTRARVPNSVFAFARSFTG